MPTRIMAKDGITAGDRAEPAGLNMRTADFARIRAMLGKSQKDLSGLLGVSLKAVESYEQGWRTVPSNIERILYLLLFKLNDPAIKNEAACWDTRSCPEASRRSCVTWLAGEGHFCWFFTGNLCAARRIGEVSRCFDCVVFKHLLSRIDVSCGKEA